MYVRKVTREPAMDMKQRPALNLGDLTIDVKNIIKEYNQVHYKRKSK